jgi:OmpA-OmpF porin, OOP family
MNRPIAATLVALAAVAAPAAHAQSPWYLGISAGTSETSDDLVRNRESTITLATDLRTDFDDRDSAWKATLGYRVNSWLAVELNYADLGRHSTFTSFMGGDAPAPSAIALDREIKAYGIDAVFMAPLGGFEVFGRIGAAHTTLDARQELFGNVVFTGGDPDERVRTASRDETVARYGVGGQWRFGRNMALRVEWERYADVGKAFRIGGSGTTGEADTDVYSVGVLFHF